MRFRRGQVALYLVAVLVAVTVLMAMNVGIYLSVSAKNRAMNAGDAAALAVARYQGELLNRIGRLNVDHLKAALENDDERCQEIVRDQLRCSFLGPISGADGGDPNQPYGGISAGNAVARENGAERLKRVEELLRTHARDVRQWYVSNPESYPEPWEGAWEEYAVALELAAGAGIWAGPDNIVFVDAASGHLLLNRSFYEAIAGKSWCWFKFNAPGLLDAYAGYTGWGPLPGTSVESRGRRRVNCEVYSLHLRARVGGAVELLGTNLICRLTGANAGDLEKSALINDPTQMWMFYDEDVWRTWREIDPFGEDRFPVMGSVKSEYDVLGCAALCRVVAKGADLVRENGCGNEFSWTAGAKPFGTVVDEEGAVDVVTANAGFVTPAFDRSRLVAIDAVGGRYLATADPDWMEHVRVHLPVYLRRGPDAVGSGTCWYCRQLKTWEHASFRMAGSIWLKFHGSECQRPTGGTCGTGGTAHGH